MQWQIFSILLNLFLLKLYHLINLCNEFFTKIYLFKQFRVFSKNFQKEFDIFIIWEFERFLKYRLNGIVSILVHHYFFEQVFFLVLIILFLKKNFKYNLLAIRC